MNKIVWLLLSSIISLYALDFHSYEEGLKLQQKSGKILMLDVMRTNCHYCKDMERKVFDNKNMSAWLNKRFIPVKLNLDFDTLPLGIHVYFTPTFFFVNKEHKIIKKVPGSWGIQDFKDLTKNIK